MRLINPKILRDLHSGTGTGTERTGSGAGRALMYG